MNPESEPDAVAHRFARRTNPERYSMLQPDVWHSVQERQREMLKLFLRLGHQDLGALSLLEVGCGAGGNASRRRRRRGPLRRPRRHRASPTRRSPRSARWPRVRSTTTSPRFAVASPRTTPRPPRANCARFESRTRRPMRGCRRTFGGTPPACRASLAHLAGSPWVRQGVSLTPNVIPANAGIQWLRFTELQRRWVPAFAGTTKVAMRAGSRVRGNDDLKQRRQELLPIADLGSRTSLSIRHRNRAPSSRSARTSRSPRRASPWHRASRGTSSRSASCQDRSSPRRHRRDRS